MILKVLVEEIDSQPSSQGLLRFQNGGAAVEALNNALTILQTSGSIFPGDTHKFVLSYDPYDPASASFAKPLTKVR